MTNPYDLAAVGRHFGPELPPVREWRYVCSVPSSISNSRDVAVSIKRQIESQPGFELVRVLVREPEWLPDYFYINASVTTHEELTRCREIAAEIIAREETK